VGIDIEKDYDNDIPKHKKKSGAKGTPRADHKHKYETAAIRVNRMVGGTPRKIIFKGEVCVVCGRVSNLTNFFGFSSKDTETAEEVWRKYPHYTMDSFMDKVAVKEPDADEPDVTCPNCFQKAKHQATWGEDLIYSCPNCLFDWRAYKNEDGNIRITERFFFG